MYNPQLSEQEIATIAHLCPPKYEPDNDQRNYRIIFYELFQHFSVIGEHVSRLVDEQIQTEEMYQDEIPMDIATSDLLRYLYIKWHAFFVLHFEFLSETRTYTFAHKTLVDNLASHVFMELSRMYALIYYNTLIEEKESIDRVIGQPTEEQLRNWYACFSLKLTKQDCWVDMIQVFTVRYDDEEDENEIVETTRERVTEMWEKPVMRYNQSDVIVAIMYLTQLAEMLPSNSIDEFRHYFNLLYLRNSSFFMEGLEEDVLTDELMRIQLPKDLVQESEMYFANRDYLIFCGMYFGHLLRRFYYYDVLRENSAPIFREQREQIAAATERCKNWITSTLAARLSDEIFEDLYTQVCDEAYDFGGDAAWFKYSYPRQIQTRGNILAELRPHMHKRFFSEARINKNTVISAVNKSPAARLFVLKVVDQFLRIQCNIEWINAVVVENSGIEDAGVALTSERCPLIVQGFSSYWAYDRGLVYETDDIFCAIATWFYLLDARYDGKLYDVSLKKYTQIILGQREEIVQATFEI